MTVDSNTVSRWDVRIPSSTASLDGTLSLPRHAIGMVIFAHGSGSSRHSPRNTFVADVMNVRGLGTLLVDLLTPREAEKEALRFDIALLAERVLAAVEWTRSHKAVGTEKTGIFGASTGAAAALIAAAQRPNAVSAIVSRGGRLDLAGAALEAVTAPTLLIVGSLDHAVLQLNLDAARALSHCQLEQVPGAGHLFEEPGALPAVADLASNWLTLHLRVDGPTVGGGG
jgi:pimeloyl-ACP methyl ester carboxylesterase